MEYRGPWADIEIPEKTLYELIFESLDPEEATRLAFDHAETGETLTFGELKHHVDAVATWLHDNHGPHGSAPQPVVALVLANCPAYGIGFHGVLRGGGVVTPVNQAASAPEITRQLALTHASTVLTSAALLGKVEQALAALPAGHEVRIIVVDPTDETPAAHLSLAEVLATPPAPPTLELDTSTAVACLPVSSGTSGMPKAVMLSHRNLVANMLQFVEPLAPAGDDNSVVAFLPYSHIYALTTNLNHALYRRFTQYTMSSFQAHLFLDIVATRRPTMLFVVPPVATFLARSAAAAKVSWESVRLVVSGAAPLDEAVGDAMQERLGCRVVQGYGMTETSPVTHVVPLDRHDIGLGTIGQAVPCVRFRVVDPATGHDVETPTAGQWSSPGELWIAGPNTMLGYLDEEQATDAVKDADGWVHTGDLVQVDHEGTTRVVDRIKELIKRRGFQIAPAELEAHLAEHPDVADAAVLGLGHGSGDQVPHALLVLNPDESDMLAEQRATRVLAWLNERVAPYKHVTGATVVDALPRSAAGKILRRELPALVG